MTGPAIPPVRRAFTKAARPSSPKELNLNTAKESIHPLFCMALAVLAPVVSLQAQPEGGRAVISIQTDAISAQPLELNLGVVPANLDIPFSINITGVEPGGEQWTEARSSCGCTVVDFSPEYLAAGERLNLLGKFRGKAEAGKPRIHQRIELQSTARTITLNISAEIFDYGIKILPRKKMRFQAGETNAPLPVELPVPGYKLTRVFVPTDLEKLGLAVKASSRSESDYDYTLQLTSEKPATPAAAYYPHSTSETISALAVPASAGIEYPEDGFIVYIPVTIESWGQLLPDKRELDLGFVGLGESTTEELCVSGPENLCSALRILASENISASITGIEAGRRRITISYKSLKPSANSKPSKGFFIEKLQLTTSGESLEMPVRFAR